MDIPAWMESELYPFDHRYYATGAGRMHYVDEGAGAPMVMVHGNPTWSFLYRHLIRAYRGEFRCVVPDHLGFGLSDKPVDWTYLPKDHAENLTDLIDSLGLGGITLIVQDWGGPIGLSYAIDNPRRVRRLIILNTWMWPVDRDPYYLLYSRFMGGRPGRFLIRRYNFFARVIMPAIFADRSRLSPRVHQHYLEALAEPAARTACWTLAREVVGSTEWLAGLWDRTHRLEEMEILIAWGMRDFAFRERELDRWIERFPSACVRRLPDTGHYVQEEAPQTLIGAIDDHMRAGRASSSG